MKYLKQKQGEGGRGDTNGKKKTKKNLMKKILLWVNLFIFLSPVSTNQDKKKHIFRKLLYKRDHKLTVYNLFNKYGAKILLFTFLLKMQ